MAPPQILEPIDILEYRSFGKASGFPTVSPDKLCPEGFEEREEDQETVRGTVSATQDASDSHVINIAHRGWYVECHPLVGAATPRPCLMPGSPALR
jgi:hypothetical protein